ncbi:fungal hydrophobin [Imleria badia]|nr:fungal hydrophobin [Imleria badia]
MLVHNALAALPFVALAYGGPLFGRNPKVCNTGTIQCCQSVQSAGSPLATALAPLLSLSGILLGNGQIGLQCNSLTGAGSSCESNPVCCNDTHFDGFINVGCSPISL